MAARVNLNIGLFADAARVTEEQPVDLLFGGLIENAPGAWAFVEEETAFGLLDESNGLDVGGD